MQWLLPEGVDEILPPGGWVLEDIRRKVLDTFRARDFQLILPPLVEHADALLSGVGSELDLLTFRLTDQLSGRQLAVRADITPQAARIDARHLAAAGVARVCYLGTVMRTRPEVPGGARCYRQLGAELFGDTQVSADAEILDLMVSSLQVCGLQQLHLDLGHVGVFRALSQDLSLSEADHQALFELLQIKASEEVRQWCRSQGLSAQRSDDLATLCTLHGGLEVLDQARQRFAGQDAILAAIDELDALCRSQQARHADIPLHLDLAELYGYRYHTGVVFAAFVPGQGRDLARGGRYNGVGANFGADRPATGFSADLNRLVSLGTGLKEA